VNQGGALAMGKKRSLDYLGFRRKECHRIGARLTVEGGKDEGVKGRTSKVSPPEKSNMPSERSGGKLLGQEGKDQRRQRGYSISGVLSMKGPGNHVWRNAGTSAHGRGNSKNNLRHCTGTKRER